MATARADSTDTPVATEGLCEGELGGGFRPAHPSAASVIKPAARAAFTLRGPWSCAGSGPVKWEVRMPFDSPFAPDTIVDSLEPTQPEPMIPPPGPPRVLVAAALFLSTTFISTTVRADYPPRALDQHFTIDPVVDITVSAAGAGLSGLSELILSTGEILPQKPGSSANLLSFDRIAVTQTIDRNASTYSDIGLGLALGFAAVDPFLSAARDGWDAALVDAVMYAESLSVTLALTDATKIAVRRPRPIDYLNVSTNPSDTNLNLSFFSGHSALAASVTATATYIAFIRAPQSPRPWITLCAGSLLTAFVSYERVRSGAHFPTDVIAGSLVGGAIGVLVPHLHRHGEERPSVWVGLAPSAGGGMLSVHGIF
jgi:membrane-associated phospholipid phosphatase